MSSQCKHLWQTLSLTGDLICFDCGEPIAPLFSGRPIKVGDVLILKKYNVCGLRTVASVGEWGIVFTDGGSVRTLDFERFGLEHADGTPVTKPDPPKDASPPPSKPAWKVWRDAMTRKGECPCGIPQGVCAYHKKSA